MFEYIVLGLFVVNVIISAIGFGTALERDGISNTGGWFPALMGWIVACLLQIEIIIK